MTERMALVKTIQTIQRALDELLEALTGQAGQPRLYAPLTPQTPMKERRLRQALVVQAVLNAGGRVTHEEWLKIVQFYGYASKGASGLIRGDRDGSLLLLDGDVVQVSEHGRQRLRQHRGAVADALATERLSGATALTRSVLTTPRDAAEE